jgi:hypothetical protein
MCESSWKPWSSPLAAATGYAVEPWSRSAQVFARRPDNHTGTILEGVVAKLSNCHIDQVKVSDKYTVEMFKCEPGAVLLLPTFSTVHRSMLEGD